MSNFLWEHFVCKKNCSNGTSNMLQGGGWGGGGQWSVVKDNIFTFFLGPFPKTHKTKFLYLKLWHDKFP